MPQVGFICKIKVLIFYGKMGFQSTSEGFTYLDTKIMYVNQELSIDNDVQLISVTYFQSNTVLKAKI